MMAPAWPEITAVRSENRRELSLIGPDISKRIEDNGLDENIYELVNLNLLDISRTCLSSLSEDVGRLCNLTNLTLQNNVLRTIPTAIGQLTKLKFLDISHNKLETLPAEISQLGELQSFNASVNCLTSFPDVSLLRAVRILNIAHNKLTALPDGICDESLVHLSQINANNNEITSLPAELSSLPHLNSLHVGNNKLETLPPTLSECIKLKELTVSGNKIKDRKLGKFAEQNSLKQIMAFLSAVLEKETAAGKDKKAKSKKKKKNAKEKDVEELARNIVIVLRFTELIVKVDEKVAGVRPFIVCCVLRNINFGKSLNTFKRFISLQTDLHDGICQKRQQATIATHDLSLVKGPLTYTAKNPDTVMITPLFKSKEVSANDLLQSLRQEAESLRKEKKRSQVSGIHKYLDLLKDKEEFPVLLDAEGHAISLPPITNSDKTKISKDTQSVLVEVTSSASLDFAKKVMDTFLQEVLMRGIGTTDDSAGKIENGEEPVDTSAIGADGDGSGLDACQRLVVEQVKIVDEEGNLKVLYPSRTDLQAEDFEVMRPEA